MARRDELRRTDLFRAGNFLRNELAFVVLLPLDLDGVDVFHVAVVVAVEFFRGGEINARITAKFRGGFFLAVIQLVNLRPFGPGIILGALHRRLGQNFDLHQAVAAVAHGGADAIGAGIAAADDDDVLAFGGDEIAVLVLVEQRLGVRGAEIPSRNECP